MVYVRCISSPDQRCQL